MVVRTTQGTGIEPPTPRTETLQPGGEARAFLWTVFPPEVQCGGVWTRLEGEELPAGRVVEVVCEGDALVATIRTD